MQEVESIPFRQPVDPNSLGIPDYFDIVRKPMDMSTILSKLKSGQYSDPWEYVDDVWLMFDNAWLYNRKTSRVYRYCTRVSTLFNFISNILSKSKVYPSSHNVAEWARFFETVLILSRQIEFEMYFEIDFNGRLKIVLISAVGNFRASDRSSNAIAWLLLWSKIHIQSSSTMLLRQATVYNSKRRKILQLLD